MARLTVRPSVAPQVVGVPQAQALAIRPVASAVGQQTQAIGRGMAELGTSLSDIAIHQQRDRDDAIIKDRDSLFSDAIFKHFDSEDGYLNTVGEAAVTGTRREDAVEAIEKARDELLATTENSHQQDRFREMADARMRAVRTRVDNHYVDQTRVFATGRSEARIETALRDARVAPPGSQDFATQYGIITNEAAALARLSGASPEKADLIRRTALSRLHGDVLQSASDRGQASFARDYLNANRKDMTSAAIEAAERPLAEGLDRETAAKLAIDLDKLPRASDRYDALDEQLKNEQISEEVYQRTGQMIDQREARKHRQVAQDTLTARNEAVGLLDADRDSRQSSIPRPLESLLTPTQIARVKELGLYQDLKDYETNGRWVTTEVGSWLMKDMTEETFRGLEWEHVENGFRKHVSNDDLAVVQKLYAKANSLPVPTTVHGYDTEFRDTMLNKLLGPLPDKATPEQKAQRDATWSELVTSVTKTAPPNAADARERMEETVKFRLRETVVNRSGESTYLSLLDPETAATDYQVVVGDVTIRLDELRKPETRRHAIELARQSIAQLKRIPSVESSREIAVLEKAIRTNNPHTLAVLLAGEQAQINANAELEAKAATARAAAEKAKFVEDRAATRRAVVDEMGDRPRKPYTPAERQAVVDDIIARVLTDVDLFEIRDQVTPIRDAVDALVRSGAVPDTPTDRRRWRGVFNANFIERARSRAADERIGTMSRGPYGN